MKFDPVRLAEGVTRRHAFAAVYASLTTISLLVFINLIQPYLLINVLALPATDIGSVTGRLGSVHEGVAIVTMCLIGGLSDRWGRRAFYAAGFFFMGLGYVASFSSELKNEPVKVRMPNRDFVLFRDGDGKAHCLSNVCPHRGRLGDNGCRIDLAALEEMDRGHGYCAIPSPARRSDPDAWTHDTVPMIQPP